ncbi:serine/threonine-protein kinase [Hyalangium rubrum]|uniref:Serine/threonine-protein kinase n=1 Tax=Hyalangium rubrum TaxID=3103134 RepID=A0ABU5H7M7_9BACT|nr:serine/threonine-protein kinase [Hyalangium sp. s54d21]MDY7229474.1 serine/threonine-protein kinase [Hyalangium sp. s54d21]
MIRVFESCGFEYLVLRPIKYGRDGAPVLLAARREYLGTDTTTVELRPLHVTHETAVQVRARLSEELQLSKFLSHRNIGKVLGYAVEENQPFLVLEHVPGCSLETVLDASALVKRKVSVGFAVTVALAVANALGHAHQCLGEKEHPLHIVHRAVSPANIQISQRGQVKLVNFGSAYSELIGRYRTPTGLLRGDAAYIAPEVLREFQTPRNRRRAAARTPPDKRADIFSLGLVLLGEITGWHPLDPPDSLEDEASAFVLPGTRVETEPAIPLEVLTARLLNFGSEDVNRATKRLAQRLRRIIAKALQVDPSERYQSTLDMADDLRGYMRDSWPKYHEGELAAEMAALIRAARKLDEHVAYGVTEPGILSTPVDVPWNIP